MRRRYALLLSGGAARGAVQVPIIEKLIAEKGPPAVVYGTSIGACHAAMVSTGQHGALRALWKGVKGTKTFQRRRAGVWGGLYSLDPLRGILRSSLGTRWNMPAYVGVVDLPSGKQKLVDLTTSPSFSEDTVERIIASSSQPGIHEPWTREGLVWADGGLKYVIPRVGYSDIRIVNDIQVDEVHAVACFPEDPRPRIEDRADVDGMFEQVSRAVDVLVSANMQSDVRYLKRWARRGMTVGLYSAPWFMIGASFDARPDTIERRLQLGAWMYENRRWL